MFLFSAVSSDTFLQLRDFSTVQRLFYSVKTFLRWRDFSMVYKLFYGVETFSAETFYSMETFLQGGDFPCRDFPQLRDFSTAYRTSNHKLHRDKSVSYGVWTLFMIGEHVTSLMFIPLAKESCRLWWTKALVFVIIHVLKF